ncbi:hypothetical protein P4O66_017327, partial [Electrophorus voltai]
MNSDNSLCPIANTVSFLIFWRRKCMLSKSSTMYLMAMAVADTAVLVFIVVLELSVKYHTVEPFWSREPWCNLRDIFSYGAYNASTWLVVVFTAERFLAITTWGMRNRLCHTRAALWVIGGVFVLGHLFAVPHYWAYVSVHDRKLKRWFCVYRTDASVEYVGTVVSLQTALSHVLPFVVVGVTNSLTLRQISLSNRVHVEAECRAATRGHKVPPLLRSRKRKSVVLLVTVSMTFVLLSITRSITQIVLRSWKWDIDHDDYSLEINVAADIGNMLTLLNSAVNMYLYACTQSKFRQEVLTCVRYFLCRGCLDCN